MKRAGRFLAGLFSATMVCALVWSLFVTDRLYHCTDAVPGFDYVIPGNWVHGDVATVTKIRAGRSMSEPDVVKEGWSRNELWVLWSVMLGASLVVGVGFAFYPRGKA